MTALYEQARCVAGRRPALCALSQEVFDISEAQTEAVIEPDSVADDLAWESVSAVACLPVNASS